jgi:hypothetical protein
MSEDSERNLVSEAHACPDCGERDVDRLQWVDDGDRPLEAHEVILDDEDVVQCLSCGLRHDPLT